MDAPKKCLEGTRTQLLSLIQIWLQDISPKSKPSFWLNGIAGVGKSTIAVTIAEFAVSLGLLGACFFFSRTAEAELRDPRLVFPSLAYQMANHNPALRKLIIEAIESDRDVASESLNQQAEKLIIGPLKALGAVDRPILFVLDALDECEGPGAKEVLQLLLTAAAQVPATLKVFITSRPEAHIVQVFKKPGHVQHVVLHDIEESIVQSDIKRYLRVSLQEVPAELDLSLSPAWLKEDELTQLTKKAGKLFIHAATSVRFIADDQVSDPRAQLAVILGHSQTSHATNPYIDLDRLYIAVLRRMVSSSNDTLVLERFQAVIGTIVLLRDPLTLLAMSDFLDRSIDNIRAALKNVQSVLISPEKDDQPAYTYHPSFTDFITEPSRCRDSRFFVDRKTHETRLAQRCLEIMVGSLRRDIASIGSQSVMNREVDQFDSKVKSAIQPHLSYACRWWASHLTHADPTNSQLHSLLDQFVSVSLLWWIEALSLLEMGPLGVECVQLARVWAVGPAFPHPCSQLTKLLGIFRQPAVDTRASQRWLPVHPRKPGHYWTQRTSNIQIGTSIHAPRDATVHSISTRTLSVDYCCSWTGESLVSMLVHLQWAHGLGQSTCVHRRWDDTRHRLGRSDNPTLGHDLRGSRLN